MMRIAMFCASLALVATLTNPARANFITGNDLHNWCQSQGQSERSICMAFIVGVADMIQSGKKHSSLDTTACFPDTINGGQVVDVAKKWLADNPQSRHIVASDLVMMAMEQAFPCKKR